MEDEYFEVIVEEFTTSKIPKACVQEFNVGNSDNLKLVLNLEMINPKINQ